MCVYVCIFIDEVPVTPCSFQLKGGMHATR